MSKQASEEENKELNRVEERLKELSKCELFLDNIFIKDKTARQILVSAYNKLERQQKEIKKEKSRIMELAELLDKQENEIKFLKGELEIQEGRYISKDKIREKKEKYDEIARQYRDKTNMEARFYLENYYYSRALEELLEEN